MERLTNSNFQIPPLKDASYWLQVYFKLKDYENIGTVEELEEAKTQFDNINSAVEGMVAIGLCNDEDAKESILSLIKYQKSIQALEALEEIQQYRAIGTVDELKALQEKNEPKKVIEHETPYFVHWQCGNCGAEFYSGQIFCDDCGHPADWGELLK